MNPLVTKLEKRLLPEFEEVANNIRRDIPNITVSVASYSVGSDEYLGHGYSISCLLTPSWDYDIDLVDLCVNLSHLVEVPKIDAYVCWGHPSGYVEAEFPEYVKDSSNNSLVVSDEVLEDLYKDLPRLYEVLFAALRRRKPSYE